MERQKLYAANPWEPKAKDTYMGAGEILESLRKKK